MSTIKDMVTKVLDNGSTVIDGRVVPVNKREKCLAKALQHMLKDLHPMDPRLEMFDNLCKGITGDAEGIFTRQGASRTQIRLP